MEVQMWDTAGQERFASLGISYYRGASGAFIVFDVANRISFNSVKKWVAEIRLESDPNVTIVLIGNKIDKTPREVNREDAEALAKELGGIPYFETSCLSGEGIAEAASGFYHDLFSWTKGDLVKVVFLGDSSVGEFSSIFFLFAWHFPPFPLTLSPPRGCQKNITLR